MADAPFDAELLDSCRLTVALAQAALDVDCGSHGQFCAPPRPKSMGWLGWHKPIQNSMR